MKAHRHAVPPDVFARALQGDRDARTELVRAVGPLVLGLCRRLSVSPDDCFQAVWERVFRSLHRFDPDGPARLSTWVATLAHRHLVDARRRRGRRGQVVPLRGVPSPEPDAERELMGAERKAALDRAVQRLPDDLKRVVVAHHVGGLPLAVIAEQEGLPVGTVKSRLHRARAMLVASVGGRR